jgi:hypothetical protein
MKVWLSGEIQDDVDGAYHEASKAIRRIVETGLQGRSYGKALDELSLICIVLEDVDDYPEVKKYEKRDRVFDIRLQIPHDSFKTASPDFQQQMVMYTLLRAIKEMRSLAIRDIDYDRLEADVLAIAKQHGFA